MTTMKVTFKPKHIASQLVSVVENERARDVLTRRYGLIDSNTIETLESVGQSYSITRERVRQIENHAIKSIQKSERYKDLKPVFDELRGVFEQFGGVTSQHELIKSIAKTKADENALLFLCTVGEQFYRVKEGGDFVSHWYIDEAYAKGIRDALTGVFGSLDDSIVLPEEEIVARYKEELAKAEIAQDNAETLLRWLSLSKKIARNPLGEWGLTTSPSVRVKGMRDFAYLTLKRHGSPMHFSEVAQQIEELFGRKAHVATTHNELIKDPRFVLVGRGLYALAEWGYSKGVVKDVIRELLKELGPLTKKEIIDRVKRERYVKDNTIAVNLQDSDTFTRLEDGRFELV
ncbi:hypothetical protein CL652_02980 [bacterium]|nr:hypothetical protein [bacterium]|tara:strand:- start:26146 stop:27183 length:1038 start_codon:yes stop_codon:yes gene_type:complete